MKAAKTWRLAGVLLLAGIATASCGKDEGTGGQGGSGVIGGSGGSGGGTGGKGGSGGGRPDGGSTNTGTTLGKACINDGQCADTKAPGLTCVTGKDAVLGEGAPPKGLCTAECSGDDDCAAFGANSLCFPFDSSGTGYCVETCSFGDPGLGTKCHDRPEFACNPTLARTDTPCTDDSDCGDGDLCLDSGTCAAVVPACLPSCRGDIDCEDGMYCDQSFLSGVCVKKKPTGKALGEPCTVRDEPDECLGFCQADAEGSTKGHCSATCGIGYECGYNSGTGKWDGVCLFASTLTAENGALGDFGFCTNTCNCTDECNDSGLKCQLLDQGALTEDFKGAGLCFGADPNGQTVEYNQCSGMGGMGSGGAGGESGGGAGGAGGEPPVSGGGEPAVGGGGAGN